MKTADTVLNEFKCEFEPMQEMTAHAAMKKYAEQFKPEWTKINPDKSNLPTDADNHKLYLFAEYYENGLGCSIFGNYRYIKLAFGFELMHRYTHFMQVDRPKN